MRSAERREACDGLAVAERVLLERERDNQHDRNAILILTEAYAELGYVPREDAKVMAPLLDAGGSVDATVKKLLKTASGHTLPVVVSKLYRPGVERPAPTARVSVLVATLTPRGGNTFASSLSSVLLGSQATPIAAPPLPRVRRGRYWLLIALALAFASYVLAEFLRGR